MSPDERATIERIKAARAQLATPIERIQFDNDPTNGPLALRVVAMTESEA